MVKYFKCACDSNGYLMNIQSNIHFWHKVNQLPTKIDILLLSLCAGEELGVVADVVVQIDPSTYDEDTDQIHFDLSKIDPLTLKAISNISDLQRY